MWIVQVAPAVIVAIIALVTGLSPELPRWKKLLVIVLTAISIGAIVFSQWHASHLESTHQQTNAEATKAISALIDEGATIQQTFLDGDDPALIRQQYEDWSAKTIGILNDKLGPSYATSFKSAPGVLQVPVNHNLIGGGYWSLIEGKKTLLNNRQSK
jgi:membrane protein implicated in regulation of membrane protease activity